MFCSSVWNYPYFFRIRNTKDKDFFLCICIDLTAAESCFIYSATAYKDLSSTHLVLMNIGLIISTFAKFGVFVCVCVWGGII